MEDFFFEFFDVVETEEKGGKKKSRRNIVCGLTGPTIEYIGEPGIRWFQNIKGGQKPGTFHALVLKKKKRKTNQPYLDAIPVDNSRLERVPVGELLVESDAGGTDGLDVLEVHVDKERWCRLLELRKGKFLQHSILTSRYDDEYLMFVL